MLQKWLKAKEINAVRHMIVMKKERRRQSLGTPLGKWTKYKILSEENNLKEYLPETKLLTKDTFADFLRRYGQAIIKPSFGSLGKRIFKVSALGNDQYEVHGGAKKEIIVGMHETYKSILSRVSKNKNIIQQVIQLASKNGYPFDVRVMVQRKKGSSNWVVTGKVAKIAGRGYFVTNVAREVKLVEEAINQSNIINSSKNAKSIMKEIEKVSLNIVHTLHAHYPERNEMGIDIGIDEHGKIWIIEVNMKPMLTMFSFLQDKSMLEEILKFRKEHS